MQTPPQDPGKPVRVKLTKEELRSKNSWLDDPLTPWIATLGPILAVLVIAGFVLAL